MELSMPYLILLSIVVLVIGISLIYTLSHRSQEFQCNVLKFLNTIVPISAIRPEIPSYCSTNKQIPSYEIFHTNKDEIASELAAYILACYEKSERASLSYDIDCFQIEIKNNPSKPVTQLDLKNALPRDYKDIFRMRNSINSRDTLLIMYNASSKLVEVL